MSKQKSSKFLLGAALGALAGILFAPKSGKATRADIKRTSKKAAKKAEVEGKKAARKVQSESKKALAQGKREYNKAKRSATKSYNTTKRKVAKASKALKD